MSDRYTDQILKQADLALEALGNELLEGEPRPDSAILDIEFGSAELPASELREFPTGKIIAWDEPAQPTVTLYYGGGPAAEGILMIQDDLVAIRITQKKGEPNR